LRLDDGLGGFFDDLMGFLFFLYISFGCDCGDFFLFLKKKPLPFLCTLQKEKKSVDRACIDENLFFLF